MAAQRQKHVQAAAPVEEVAVAVMEEDAYHQIEKLAEVGVNAGDIKKAREAGYYTIQVRDEVHAHAHNGVNYAYVSLGAYVEREREKKKKKPLSLKLSL